MCTKRVNEIREIKFIDKLTVSGNFVVLVVSSTAMCAVLMRRLRHGPKYQRFPLYKYVTI